jgi:UDP-GlcNAc:undecaprenyl-phosphate/decaprenyl-phosphate GlcNAc-1-phosphate transferase
MLIYFYESILISLTVSFALCYIIIIFSNKLKWFVNESDLNGVQKFHIVATPRIAGIPIFVSFFIGLWFVDFQEGFYLLIFIASLPVFIAGLLEDFTARIPPRLRLIATFLSITMVFVWLDIGVNFLGFEWIDYFLSNYVVISFLFTLLVVGGLVNSINIIDGYNGLMVGYSVLALLAIVYIAHILGDDIVMQLCLILIASLLGFFVFNFPFCKIFMGDGGAYFVGFIMAVIGLTLVARHEDLSNWLVLLIFIYPMYELLYSIYRRKIIHNTDASQPDANHLHSLVYRKLISCDRFKHNKVICNSMVSPFMWLLSLVGIIPAVIWFDNQTMLIISAFLFMFIYTIIYKYISSDRFKFNH